MAVYDLSITDALLSTTRAVRKRLDFERPVSNDIIHKPRPVPTARDGVGL